MPGLADLDRDESRSGCPRICNRRRVAIRAFRRSYSSRCTLFPAEVCPSLQGQQFQGAVLANDFQVYIVVVREVRNNLRMSAAKCFSVLIGYRSMEVADDSNLLLTPADSHTAK